MICLGDVQVTQVREALTAALWPENPGGEAKIRAALALLVPAGTADPERDALEACAEALRSIQTRCREGDRRSNWLPTIDRIAEDALSRLRAVRGAAGSGAGEETAC